MSSETRKPRALRELILFAAFLIGGVILLPPAIYFVGQAVFGSYGAGGLGDFYTALLGRLRAFDAVTWFLMLSPYLGIQILRMARYGWRSSAAP